MIRYLTVCLFLCAASLTSCNDPGNREIPVYEGPLREVENVERYQSENSKVTIKMKAPLIYEFQEGDVEFPKGVYMEFYDEAGKISSTLRANHAYYFKKEDKWRGQGDVEVKNLEKKEQLNTEELFWKPADEKIFTEKFVTIRQQRDVIYGEGLDAKQDLSTYKILHPTGTFEVDE